MQYNWSWNNKGAGYLLWDFGDQLIPGSRGNVVRGNFSWHDSANTYYGGIHLGTSGSGRIVEAQIYDNTIWPGPGAEAIKIAVDVVGTSLQNNWVYQ
jgi:hypothetical protein